MLKLSDWVNRRDYRINITRDQYMSMKREYKRIGGIFSENYMTKFKKDYNLGDEEMKVLKKAIANNYSCTEENTSDLGDEEMEVLTKAIAKENTSDLGDDREL